MRRIGLVPHRDRPAALDLARRMTRSLQDAGVSVVLPPNEAVAAAPPGAGRAG